MNKVFESPDTAGTPTGTPTSTANQPTEVDDYEFDLHGFLVPLALHAEHRADSRSR